MHFYCTHHSLLCSEQKGSINLKPPIMGCMDKFLVDRKFGFVTAYEYEDSYIDDDGHEYGGMIETFGYSIIENTFEGISVEGNTITMGNRDIIIKVDSCVKYKDCDLQGKLPSLYCIRQHNGSWARFVCGMDLCRNGMIWVGLEYDMFFGNINSALSYLNDRLGEFVIHLEEPMRENFVKQ